MRCTTGNQLDRKQRSQIDGIFLTADFLPSPAFGGSTVIVSSDMSLTPRATIALQVMGFPVVSSKELIVDTTTGVCVCVRVCERKLSSLWSLSLWLLLLLLLLFEAVVQA